MGVVFRTHSLSHRSLLWPLEKTWQCQFSLINVWLQGPLRGHCEGQVSSVAFSGCVFLVGELNLRQSHLLPPGVPYLSPPRMALAWGLFSVPYFFSNGNLSPAQETLGLESGVGSPGPPALSLHGPLAFFPRPRPPCSPDLDAGSCPLNLLISLVREPPWPFCLRPVGLLLLPR